jgi:acetoacetyl-CoA synthetase
MILSDKLIQSIKLKIKERCSPRHVPSIIKDCPDIPRTKSGKIVEIVVKKILNKENITNTESLANPETLEFFKNLTI